jgi:hypothetical protein
MTDRIIHLHRCVETPVCAHGVQKFLLCHQCAEDERCECDYGECAYCERRRETAETAWNRPEAYTDLRETRHVTIHPAIPLSHVAVMIAVAAAIGAMIAVGHS